MNKNISKNTKSIKNIANQGIKNNMNIKNNSNKISRKNFLRAGSALSLAALYPRMLQAANAIDKVAYKKPALLPTVIHIFLYGGASELMGNFTNASDIFSGSQSSYPQGSISISSQGFWQEAGGAILERLIDQGDASIYRTIYRRKANHRAHGLSIAQNLVGNLDASKAGIATNLALILSKHGGIAPGALLPFVSLEGNSAVFQEGSLALESRLRPASLTAGAANPFRGASNPDLSVANQDRLQDLANESSRPADESLIAESIRNLMGFFRNKKSLANFMDTLTNAPLPAGVSYPAGNPLADRLRTALNIAIQNPDTRYISLGNGGIGGWDAHSGAIPTYTRNMTRVMEAISAAVAHMKAAGAENRIIIEVYADFGRNVNLNAARGWDHGNNMNYYIFGGNAFRQNGRIIGKTVLTGTPGQNRLYTAPAPGSPEFEPFSIASSIYKYFGVQNPEILTGEVPLV